MSEANRAGKPARVSPSASSREPEVPLDWSRIESALQTKQEGAPQPEPSLSRTGAELAKPSSPSSSGLHLHRKLLEEEGDESGRDVQREYRKKVIELKREQIKQQQEDSEVETATLTETWLERAGEHIGDFLAEPTAGHVFIVLSVLALVVALSLVYALQ